MGKLYRDGVALFYEEAGKGAPPLLFIHGLGGDHTTLAPQFEHFRRDHRVVAIDLRGHGQSDAPERGYAVGDLADDLAWMSYELGLHRPVLVGQGLGAVIALECAARQPDLPVGIVALATPQLATAEVRACCRCLLEGLRASAGLDELRAIIESTAAPGGDPQHRGPLLEKVARLPRHVALPILESLCAWDASASLAGCRLPLLCVPAQGPLADPARLRELCPQVQVSSLADAEDALQMGAPNRVNALLERFLRATPS